jgi:hypothetical protein
MMRIEESTNMPPPSLTAGPDVQLGLNVRGLTPSATVAINERSNALRKRGREIFKLGLRIDRWAPSASPNVKP